jgi:transcriptional regulator with XRE-family HTH domain
MEVLEKIEKLRKEKGWSINYLAMESGLTQSTLNNLYSRNTEPKISTLRAICGAFGITLSEFFKEEENKDALLQIVKNLK